MKSLIVANWKCNPLSLTEAKRLFDSIKKGVKNIKNVEVVICPPFIYLPELKTAGSRVKLGGQNCFWEDKGAFTGEVSAKMLKNLDSKYVIIGHSERRGYFRETDSIVNRKINSALQNGLRPILCIGETEEEKRKGEFSKVIRSQIEKGLKKVPRTRIKEIAVAYEPIWAIGTGKACQPVQAQITNLLIRKVIARLYSRGIADKIPVLYGGSVNENNALRYLEESRMAGLLIGGASLRPKEFVGIAKDASTL